MNRGSVIAVAAGIGLVVLSVGLDVFAVGQEATAQITGYQRTADPRRIVVIVNVFPATDILEREAKEDGTTVRVTVRVRNPSSSPALGVPLPVVVSLQQPIGDRRVLDQNGAPVPDLGTYRSP